jgi:hypothetical protein
MASTAARVDSSRSGYVGGEGLCRASRHGNDAPDPPEYDKPDTGSAVPMIG